jgi:ElaB/YqjD/DUF883 family membrane-anchored ribosome-binding protein
MTTQKPAKPANGTANVDALRDEIRQTRAELGETVQALAAKADVKARMRESAAQTAAQVRESAGQAVERARHSLSDAGQSARSRPAPWLAAAGGAAVLVVLLVIRSRRRR